MEKSYLIDELTEKEAYVEDLPALINKREEKLIQLQKSYQYLELKFSELQRNFETEKRNSADLEKVLDWTKKLLKSKCADVEELEHKLQCSEIIKSQVEFELHMLLIQMEEELQSKNSLNEKLNQQLSNVRFLLEIERDQHFTSDHCMKVENDVNMVIEKQLKEQSKIKEDVLKQVESFKRKMNDYNRKIEEVHADKNRQTIMTEKIRQKVKVLETEITELRTELVLKTNESTIFLENKKKMYTLEKKLEEKKLENKALICENKSLKSELSSLKAVQISIQTLYNMIDGLLDQIVDDSRERLAQEKIIRKLQKKLHEHVKEKGRICHPNSSLNEEF